MDDVECTLPCQARTAGPVLYDEAPRHCFGGHGSARLWACSTGATSTRSARTRQLTRSRERSLTGALGSGVRAHDSGQKEGCSMAKAKLKRGMHIRSSDG